MELKKTENVVKIENFNKDFIKVFNTKNLCTLINKNDLSYPYPNLWFSDWEDFDENCYLVRECLKSTLIHKFGLLCLLLQLQNKQNFVWKL